MLKCWPNPLKMIVVTVVACFCEVEELSAQLSVYEQPIYFNQFFNDPQINSVPLLDDKKVVFTLAARRNSNDFGGVNTSIFTGLFKLGKSDASKFGVFGLQVLNDKEGALIQRNRLLPSYTQHIRVSKKYNVAGGVGLGFYNFLIKSDLPFEGASDFTLDLSFLVKFYSENTNIQITVNQASNSKVIPVVQEIILGRSFNLFANHQFKLADYLSIIPSAYGRMSKEQELPPSGFAFGVGTHFLIDNLSTVGVSYEYKSGYNFFAGLKEMKVLNSKLSFELSYFVPGAKSQRTNVQMFELVVKYFLIKKKSEK